MVRTDEGETVSLRLAAARRGDLDAFISILRDHDRRLRAVAWHLIGDRGLMDDALQEVAIKTARALPQLRDDAALAAWLRQTTYRVCIDLLRRESHWDPRAPEDMPERESPGSDPADTVIDRDLVDRILETLPPDQRAAVVLVDQEGLDYATTAELLGVPAGTVASRLNNARAKLRVALTAASDDRCLS